ncbi:hypothetical protein [Chitinophaga caeni]|nr:hypothetical protein [Chitinophaga caeni]
MPRIVVFLCCNVILFIFLQAFLPRIGFAVGKYARGFSVDTTGDEILLRNIAMYRKRELNTYVFDTSFRWKGNMYRFNLQHHYLQQKIRIPRNLLKGYDIPYFDAKAASCIVKVTKNGFPSFEMPVVREDFVGRINGYWMDYLVLHVDKTRFEDGKLYIYCVLSIPLTNMGKQIILCIAPDGNVEFIE